MIETFGRCRIAAVACGALSLLAAGAASAAPGRNGDNAVLHTVAGAMTVVTSTGKFSHIALVDAPAGAPASHDYPVGFVGLSIKQIPKGGETTLSFHLPAGVAADLAMKCIGADCAEFPSTLADGVLSIVLRDGGPGDADGEVNGRISDPVAPARLAGGASCPFGPGEHTVHEWEGSVGVAIAGIAPSPADSTETFDVPAGCEAGKLTVQIAWDLFVEDLDLEVIDPSGTPSVSDDGNTTGGTAAERVLYESATAGPYSARTYGWLSAATAYTGKATLTIPDATTDADHDGKSDAEDNCPTVYNPSQDDADGNAAGDACDVPAVAIPANGTAQVFSADGTSGITVQGPPSYGVGPSFEGTGYSVDGALEHRYRLTLSNHYSDYSELRVRVQWPLAFADYFTLEGRSPAGQVVRGVFVNTNYQELVFASPVAGEYALVVRESRTTGGSFTLTGKATRATRPDFGPIPDIVSDTARPRVVVAVLDSGINPYHEFYYAGSPAYPNGHPSAVTQEVLDAFGVRPENVVQLTRTGNLANDVAADAAFWSRVTRGETYHFKGTNIIARSFAAGSDVVLRPDVSKSPHGVGTSSTVLTANPDAVLLFVEQASALGSEESHAWALRHPAVDVSTTSYGVSAAAPVVGSTGFPLPEYRAFEHTWESVVGLGKLHFSSGGNGPGLTPLRAGAGPWWSIGVSGIEEYSSEGDSLLSGNFPDFVADFTQILPYCMDCEAGTREVGGTSFSTPRAAGVASRVIYEARRARGHVGGITTVDGVPVLVAGTGTGTDAAISNWRLRRALEEAAWTPDSLAYDPVDGVFDLAGLPINPAAPWLQVGWGDLTADAQKRVVPTALAELGFGGATRPKPAGFCEFQTVIIGERKLYWDSIAPALGPAPSPFGGEVPPGAPAQDPFVYCAMAGP